VDYLPRSPDLIPLYLFLWGALNNAVCTSKQRTLQDLRREIKIACASVPLVTIQNVANLLHFVVNNALLLVVDILNICDFKCENITVISIFICEL
jgi:hypothetical protein